MASKQQFWEADARNQVLRRLESLEGVKDAKAFYADLNEAVDRLCTMHATVLATPPPHHPSPVKEPQPQRVQSAFLQRQRPSLRDPLVEAPHDPAAQTRAWLGHLLGLKIGEDVAAELKSGVLLCQLANAIKPGIIAKWNPQASPFAQRDNISKFLKAAEELGVTDTERFAVEDLYSVKNLKQVYICVLALSDAVRHSAPEFPGPYIEKQRRSSCRPSWLVCSKRPRSSSCGAGL